MAKTTRPEEEDKVTTLELTPSVGNEEPKIRPGYTAEGEFKPQPHYIPVDASDEALNAGGANSVGFSSEQSSTNTVTDANKPDYQKLQLDIDNAKSKYQSERAQYFDEIAKFMEPPLTEEQRRKREKAAIASAGFGSLGNVANAFSNLVWTGKGAPSQKLPESPDFSKAIDTFRADEREKMKNYISQGMNRLAMYKGDWDEAKAEYDRQRKLDYDAEQMKYNLEILRAKAVEAAAKGDYETSRAMEEQYKAGLAQLRMLYEPTRQKNEADYVRAGIGQRKASAYASRMAGKVSGARIANLKALTDKYKAELKNIERKGGTAFMLSSGKIIDIPKDATDKNAAFWSGLVRMTGENPTIYQVNELPGVLNNYLQSENADDRIISNIEARVGEYATQHGFNVFGGEDEDNELPL